VSKKKGEEFDLESYSDSEKKTDIVYKPDTYFQLHPQIAAATGFKELPLGHLMAMYGLSDSGKSAIMLQMAADCQKAGIVPIFIITEKKMDWRRAVAHGLDTSKSKCIIRSDLKHLEDVYDYIAQKIKDVKEGRLPRNVMFFWDSVASTPSVESYEILADGSIKRRYGNQKNANVIGYYNPLIMDLLNSTREESSKHTAGAMFLTQAYIKPAEFAGGMATTVPNGGEKIWFPLSLCLEIKERMKLTATVKGRKVDFGRVTKIRVSKNHLSEIATEGDFAITCEGIVPNEPNVIKKIKDDNKDRWAEMLSSGDFLGHVPEGEELDGE
jgi:RecA/RadA recombinase